MKRIWIYLSFAFFLSVIGFLPKEGSDIVKDFTNPTYMHYAKNIDLWIGLLLETGANCIETFFMITFPAVILSGMTAFTLTLVSKSIKLSWLSSAGIAVACTLIFEVVILITLYPNPWNTYFVVPNYKISNFWFVWGGVSFICAAFLAEYFYLRK